MKREALTEKYPDMCSTLKEVKESLKICPHRELNASAKLDPILFKLNGSLLKLRDELYVYARDNLAVVNIYIKDATVTKIRRDQKVITVNPKKLVRLSFQALVSLVTLSFKVLSKL